MRGDRSCKLSRLIEAPFGKTQPVHWRWRDQVGGGDQICPRPVHPASRKGGDIQPVTMFQRQDQLAANALVQHGSGATIPSGGMMDASIANPIRSKIASQRGVAKLTEISRQKRDIAPTIGADAVCGLDL